MNKLFTKIATFVAGTALAVGVGVAISDNGVREARAANPGDKVSFLYTTSSSKKLSTTYGNNNIADDGGKLSISCTTARLKGSGAIQNTYNSDFGGQQMTTNANRDTTVSFTFSNPWMGTNTTYADYTKITSVTFTAVAGSSTSYNVACTIDGVAATGDHTGFNQTKTTCTFTPAKDHEKGTIVITVTFSSGSKGWYFDNLGINAEVPDVLTKTVTYDANGGDGEMDPTEVVDGYATISACTFTNPGKYFTGWEDSEHNAYVAGQSYPFADNVTLYAQWADASMTGISIKTAPTKVKYAVGDCFKPNGMVITAAYDHDAASKDIAYAADAGFTFSPDLETALSLSDVKVTITYGGFNVDQAIVVSIQQKYKQITSQNELKANGKYIIGHSNGYFVSSTQNTNNRSAVTATVTDSEVPDADELEQFVLEGSEGQWVLHAQRAAGYLYADGSNSNYLKTRSTNTTDNGLWNITVTDGNVTINNVGNTTRGQMKYNANSGNPIFSCYATGENLKMFKLEETISASVVGNNTVDTTVEYQASVEDTDGNTVTGCKFAFTPSEGAVISASDEDAGTFTASAAGKVTVSATKDGYAITDKVVTVTLKREISSISISTVPDKLYYVQGQDLVPTGLSITVNYTSGDPLAEIVEYNSLTADQFSFSRTVIDEAGTVTVTYKGFTTNFVVYLASAVNVTGVKTAPERVRVLHTIELNEVELYVQFSNGDVVTKNPTTIEFDNTLIGDATVTATYEPASGTKTAQFTVRVHNDGDGSLEYPYSVKEALEVIAEHAGASWKSSEDFYVQGIVKPEPAPSINTHDGCDFEITDDGVNSIKAYSIPNCDIEHPEAANYVGGYQKVVILGALINFYSSGTDVPEVGYASGHTVQLASSIAPALDSVVATVSEKTRYQGKHLGLDDFTVTLNYTNLKPSAAVTSGFTWTVNGVVDGGLNVGENAVVVTYGTVSSDPINVVAVADSVKDYTITPPTDQTYYVGDTELKLAGFNVKENYNSGDFIDITASVTCTGFDSSAPADDQEISVMYNENKIGSFTIDILAVPEEPVLSSISLSGDYVTEFTVGDEFTFGGVVTAHYTLEKADADVTSLCTFTGYDMNTVGEQTVTVSYTEDEVTKTTSYHIQVSAVPVPELSGIALSGSYKTAFHVGDTFEFGGVVTASYTLGKEPRVVTDSCTFTGYDMNTVGNYTVTVAYTEDEITKTAEYSIAVSEAPVPVKTLESISVDTSAAKVSYTVGETFSSQGVVVTAHYSDESTADVSAAAQFSSPDMSTAGSKTITVRYVEDNVEKTCNYTITVSEAPAPVKVLESIGVNVSGAKTEYTVGEEFSSAGIVVTATYDDESTAVVTNVTFTGYDMTQAGTQTVTVSYTEGGVTKTATFEITVKAKSSPKMKGCGGDIIAASAILSTLALAGSALVVAKKRKEDK